MSIIITTQLDDDGKACANFLTATEGKCGGPNDYLEKMFGLSPSPTSQTPNRQRELPIHRLPRTPVRHGPCPRDEVLFAGRTERHPPKTQSEEFQGTGKT